MGGRFSETFFFSFRCIKMAIVHDIAEGMLMLALCYLSVPGKSGSACLNYCL